MLREATAAHEMDWSEKTMSMLREKQFEACERRLSGYPQIGIFSPLATDQNAQTLFECSYYASEQENQQLMTLEELRCRVLEQLPLEALFLSRGERALLERLLIAEGRITSDNWDEIDAAEALACRLWCCFAADGDEWTIDLPEQLQAPLLQAFNNPQYAKTAELMFRYDATINGLLYIAGFLHSAQPLGFFTKDVMQREDPQAVRIAYRYLKATFEYVSDLDQELILLHPGLADPYRLILNLSGQGAFSLTLTQDMMAGGMQGLLTEERPLHERMIGALQGATRPEISPEEAAEDLRILAKQGVTLDEMQAVMASMLCVQPTPLMKQAVRTLYNGTPRWVGMQSGVQN